MRAVYDWWPQWGEYRVTRVDTEDMHMTREEALERLAREQKKLWLLENHEGTMQ